LLKDDSDLYPEALISIFFSWKENSKDAHRSLEKSEGFLYRRGNSRGEKSW